MTRDHRLATYGSLAPGRSNHHELAGLHGRWINGIVRGRLASRGWGASLGYPALTTAEDGDTVEINLFISPDLPDHWQRLDAFEGQEYRRTAIMVETAEGLIEAWIYLDAVADS